MKRCGCRASKIMKKLLIIRPIEEKTFGMMVVE